MTATIIAATASALLTTTEPVAALVAFRDLGIAVENMRAANAADDEIAPLARTIAVARNVVPIIVRPGNGKNEPAFAILDGRRRYLAVKHLIDAGEADEGFQLEAKILTDPLAIQQALVLANDQRLTPHVADVIATIGGLKAQKGKPMKPAQIAKALGYELKEVKHIWHLADTHPDVLKALRADKITVAGAKRIARVTDKAQQAFFANQALEGQDWQSQLTRSGDRVDVSDDRLSLVGIDTYLAAGGRTRPDLFDELDEEILDPNILDEAWRAKLQPLASDLQERGLTVFMAPIPSHECPEGFDPLYYYTRYYADAERKAQLVGLDAAVRAAADVVQSKEFAHEQEAAVADLSAWIMAQHAVTACEHSSRVIGAVRLYAHDQKPYFRPSFFASAEEEELLDDSEEGQEDVEAAQVMTSTPGAAAPSAAPEKLERTHALHETITDYATRGLMRAVAENPAAGLIIATAQLFRRVVINSGRYVDSVSTITAEPYRRGAMDPVPQLDGEVFALLEERRAAFEASQLTPISWVESLEHHDRMSLLSELVAASLNGREHATHSQRKGSRAEAQEIAELVSYDISAYWTPTGDFLKQYNRSQLCDELAAMGSEPGRGSGMKKGDLVGYVADEAAERSYAPAELSWPKPKPMVVDAASQEQPADQPGELTDDASASDTPTAANENPAAADDQHLDVAA